MNMSFALSPEEEAKCYMSSMEAHSAPGPVSALQGELGSTALLKLTNLHRQDDDCARADGNPDEFDLSQKYDEIFGHGGNRNCASHLWAQWILDRAATCYSHSDIETLFGQFCPVAGSPIHSGLGTLWRFNLPKAGGGTASGMARHCCLPCACDMAETMHVDVKTISDKHGVQKTYEFLVVGNPCANNPPVCTTETQIGCIPEDAPHLVCENHQLKGAVLSDGGYVIMGMLLKHGDADYDFDTFIFDTTKLSLAEGCKQRAEKLNYQSGVGSCFHRMGLLNPLPREA
jgi:hypothetical protein